MAERNRLQVDEWMRGGLAPVTQDGANELPVYNGRLVFVWLHESITGVVVREPLVLTCVEHWVPLFAAKQMEVNRQLSFSISPQGQQPLIRKLHMTRLLCVIYDRSTNKHSCLVVRRKAHFSFPALFTCHSVCRWNCCRWIRRGCGCPWTRPSLFASGCPRARWSWLSSQCWQRSRKHVAQDTVKLHGAGKWGRWSQHSHRAMCVIHRPSKLRRSLCKMCVSAALPAACLPVCNNGKASSAVYRPAGLVT